MTRPSEMQRGVIDTMPLAAERLFPVVGTLGLICGLFVSSGAVSLYTVDDIIRRAEALRAASRPIGLHSLASAFGWTDAALIGITVLFAAALLLLEYRGAALSRLLQAGTRFQFALLLVAALLWLGQYCFVPGVLLGGDTATHITRFFEVRQELAAGRLPLWTNDQYLGSPLLAFTGPFTYLLGGSLDLLVRNPVVTAKILLLSTKVLTGVALYNLLRRYGLRRAAAFAGAVGFAGSFAYVHLFLYRGVFPQTLTILFLVLLFHAAEGLMTTPRTRAGDWALFAAATAGLIFNHQPHALFAAFYLFIFGLMSLVGGRWRSRGLTGLVSAGIVGVIASLGAVIPILAESNWVMIVPGNAMFRAHLPTLLRLLHLVMWRDTRTTWGTDYWAYLGDALIVLAALGGWAALSRKLGEAHRRLAVAVLACLPPAFVVWNPVVRDVMFILFFASILAALGVEWLLARNRGHGRLATLAVAALLVDTGSTAVQPVARLDKAFLINAGREIAALRPQQRVVEASLGPHGGIHVSVGPNATPMSFFANVQRVGGTHNMAATRVHNYAISIAKQAQNDLDIQRQLTPETTLLLDMLNVGRVVCWSPFRMGCPRRFHPVSEGELGGVVPVPGASPVLFARGLTRLAPAPGLDKPMLWDEQFRPAAHDPQVAKIGPFLAKWLQVTGPVRGGVATALAVRNPPEATGRPVAEAGTAAWHPRLISYHVGLQRVRLQVVTNARGYAQLAFPWYPGTLVRVNGRKVTPLQGATNLIVIALPRGEDLITLVPRLMPAERLAMWISALGLTLLAVGAVFLRVRAGWDQTNPPTNPVQRTRNMI